MVDCPYYAKHQEMTPEQQRFKSWLGQFHRKEISGIYFPLYLNGKLIEENEICFVNIDDLLYPTYHIYELVRRLLKMKLEASGGSSAIAAESSHYNNMLILLAYMLDCVSEQDYLMWEQKFNFKYNK